MDLNDRVLSKFLILEAHEKEVDAWKGTFNDYIVELLDNSTVMRLSKKTRLAIAILIIGSESYDHYLLAFNILSDWDYLGGCYWMIQEEILRHASLYIIRSAIKDEHNEEQMKSSVSANINLLVFAPTASKTHHEILEKKISLLKIDIADLVNKVFTDGVNEEELTNYKNRYPVTKFIRWFLGWAQDLLRRSPDDTMKRLQVDTPDDERQSRLKKMKFNLEDVFEVNLSNMITAKLDQNQSPNVIDKTTSNKVIRANHSNGNHSSGNHNSSRRKSIQSKFVKQLSASKDQGPTYKVEEQKPSTVSKKTSLDVHTVQVDNVRSENRGFFGIVWNAIWEIFTPNNASMES